ncbi:hypothetical protein SISNIDRAFT_482860 [Sistotremastrum niveocremeum HHB9708]|uniref:Membrane-associated proteins in eicosanoid and glutathione metabolism n=2 Tax=Sistotremastraceae TaxID=3402574 RepID=A0A164XTD8_9AGAM|nr:hypothetical protein SISNIDRAFT_482860 [Sistotremastrum niveocremeum HHB9708]KZT37011.1 hypothetical protein SISSUDRAFT_1063172 [Sistotremastrum suecicum HHB10207 ss-3]
MSFLNTPLALYTIPAAWILLMVPQVQRYSIITQHLPAENVMLAPRSAVENHAKSKAPRELVEKAVRMQGAHQNGYEVLPIYIGAVLAATYSELDNYTVNLACLAFLVSRVIYNYIYINQYNTTWANSRTFVWFFGICTTFYLYIASCNQLRAATATSPVPW